MSKPTMKRHYSGNHSKRFWTRVNKVKSDTERSSLYFAGVLLQELEERILAQLQQSEALDDLNKIAVRRAAERKPPR